jgi:DNA-binding MarR family transcriptional regulator
MAPTEKELEVLEQIYIRQDVRQRDLAQGIGLSLGMTNAILKRLTQKGFLTVRKVNNRNIAYAVSPVGVDAIARKSYRYLKRTIKHVVNYKQAIEDVISAAADSGYTEVALVGPSDLDFIVEHLCGKHGLAYERIRRVSDLATGESAFLLFSENESAPARRPQVAAARGPGPALDLESGCASLQAILVSGTA